MGETFLCNSIDEYLKTLFEKSVSKINVVASTYENIYLVYIFTR